jgi:hypothetical protein
VSIKESSIQFWVCDKCCVQGPAFKGAAEDVRPREWLIGDLEILPGPDACHSECFDCFAICPLCVPLFRDFLHDGHKYGRAQT